MATFTAATDGRIDRRISPPFATDGRVYRPNDRLEHFRVERR